MVCHCQDTAIQTLSNLETVLVVRSASVVQKIFFLVGYFNLESIILDHENKQFSG